MADVVKKGKGTWLGAGIWASLAAVGGAIGGTFGWDGVEIGNALVAISGGIIALISVFAAGRKTGVK